MSAKQKQTEEQLLNEVTSSEYKYGFTTKIDSDTIAKGLSEETARKTAEGIMKSPETALDTMAKEELGLNPNDLGSEWSSALSSLVAFSVGAFIPLVPFLFSTNLTSIYMSMLLTALALMLVGGLLANISARNLLFGSMRMLAVGGFSAIVTYGIGYGIGNFISQ